MSIGVNELEKKTQERVINFFVEVLGYDYLGNWEKREGNSNIEKEYLINFLRKQGYNDEVIKKAIEKLKKISENQQKLLYDRNKEIYELLRYGTDVKIHPSEPSIHVNFIDWENPENNHFTIAEEVTIRGRHTKRPDIVLYLNGIAIGVLELKRSSISISEGIRQNLDNQKKEFIQDFFTTVQLIIAGNDTQGLRYGTIETPERYYLEWKEENPEYDHNKKTTIPRALPRDKCEVSDNILDCDIYRLLNKNRLLEIIHDFIIFDAGIKKVPRHNQYFAVKAAQKSIKKREGGIIWHTQGSGKSLIMVWLAKWIIENISDSRVLIVTDRIELDEQIEKVFKGVGENIYRTKSARDLIEQLNRKDENLMCSLIHKFGKAEATDKDYDEYIHELKVTLPRDFKPKGNIFVFVDECHRTQSGKLHKAMKEILPNAVFIGFTGTPLLKKDKPTTLETFGKYIHTYKFDEGVQDGVILDLRYEARDVDIKVVSEDKIDKWFEVKTKGLSDIAKAQLKERWGTLKKLYSSRSRMEKIVADIIFDFETKPRLATGRGNAMLVAGSIYEACKYYELFKSRGFDKVAIVTSYRPSIVSIKGEETGEEGEAENIKKYEIYKKMIADYYNISEEEAVKDYRIEKFEKDVKKKFIEEPGQMKLLIVVDKLLTGFDAPSATYLYIDKPMRDHGLFQAICRVNRLDNKDKGDELDKDYGYIVDYRDLFNSMEKAIKDYTSGAFAEFDKEDVEGLLKDRLTDAKKRLDEVLEKVELLVEGVKPPKGINEYREYFVGDNSEEKQQLRLEFYKRVSSLVRAYTNIANELTEAGYSEREQKEIKEKVRHYAAIRDELKLMSGDYLDLKVFDPAMRYLIDSYIQAEESRTLASFEETSLLEIIALNGLQKALETLPSAIGKNKEALAETIENNIRKLIVDKRDINPAYYDKMSKILKELVEKRKKEVISYEEYLKEVEKLTKMLINREFNEEPYPPSIRSSMAKKAIYDNLEGIENREKLTNAIDEAVRKTKKDDWRGHKIKERQVRNAIKKILEDEGLEELTEKIFQIVLKQGEY
ncbi:restriction endonuclease subunit R [Thermosipho melanesiensis]|uniref:Type I restriction enzyme endonuclease subunit n=2 Tax=Thermosipho melanesiensis TaxID=46541 RepID=A6LK20_THEM4|nr:type I restriction endonuclease subunit R [Thermosipho melanesiensis]ABR30271.1 type I site-specific deoxyribonuclease, HsdR family [Thermosipho melanesiensis BI429]APT73452.1 restriction endonuclease subunit R [Thermosipho melanesiensis]OOC37397.1 restriction endonuclease subunit R [Thermosipho melanesiensis]OOC39759.1 restriction endonuclease subunit R [Thermosipho melanesiensis]OOC39864.1 restriction endonuclease subunit R [Thermosipho melanesiensis]